MNNIAQSPKSPERQPIITLELDMLDKAVAEVMQEIDYLSERLESIVLRRESPPSKPELADKPELPALGERIHATTARILMCRNSLARLRCSVEL